MLIDQSFPLASCNVTVNLIQTTGTLDDDEQIQYTTYGIELVDTSGKSVFIQRDISTDKAFVEEFIQRCIRGEARVESMIYHLEDYLAECL